jgi:hypothetical protein
MTLGDEINFRWHQAVYGLLDLNRAYNRGLESSGWDRHWQEQRRLSRMEMDAR